MVLSEIQKRHSQTGQSSCRSTSEGHEDMMGFSILDAGVSHNVATSKLLISLSLIVDNTNRNFIQAIDRLFKTHLTKFSKKFKLSKMDWKILEGLKLLLAVSVYTHYSVLNPNHNQDSSCLPANHVFWNNASGDMHNYTFWDVHDGLENG